MQVLETQSVVPERHRCESCRIEGMFVRAGPESASHLLLSILDTWRILESAGLELIRIYRQGAAYRVEALLFLPVGALARRRSVGIGLGAHYWEGCVGWGWLTSDQLLPEQDADLWCSFKICLNQACISYQLCLDTAPSFCSRTKAF